MNLNKALPLLVLPVGLSLVLLAAALKWRRRLLIALAVMVLGIFGTPFWSDLLLQSLEDRYRYVAVADTPKCDGVFVFGGMLGRRDRSDGSIPWNEESERFDRAVRLMKAGKGETLVFSGGPTRYKGGGDEGELLKQEAVMRGVPERSIIVTAETENTKAEAKQLCHWAIQLGWQRVLVVTSAYHMARVMRLTDHCACLKVPIPVAYRTPDPGSSWARTRLEYYIPQAQALLHSELALHEYLGLQLLSRGER